MAIEGKDAGGIDANKAAFGRIKEDELDGVLNSLRAHKAYLQGIAAPAYQIDNVDAEILAVEDKLSGKGGEIDGQPDEEPGGGSKGDQA